MKRIVAAIQNGDSVILENCSEDIDASLNPVLQVEARFMNEAYVGPTIEALRFNATVKYDNSYCIFIVRVCVYVGR